MARSLGLHRIGHQVAYALLERRPNRPPEILTAGAVDMDQLVELHGRLSGERPLPWGLAEERESQRRRVLESDWPLQRPPTRALLHPATAAAIWEWETGRILDDDLFLWLRPERLLWSKGMPGTGSSGSVARRGPLRETIHRVLRQTNSSQATVALALDGDAPGAGVVQDELSQANLSFRPVRRGPEERGADRAAAGAALGALEPHRDGVFAPLRVKQREPWIKTAGLVAALAAVSGATWLSRDQEQLLEEYRQNYRNGTGQSPPTIKSGGQEISQGPIPATPEELGELLARRRAMVRALEHLLPQVPEGSLEELEMVTARGSQKAQVRLRLLPGGPAETPTNFPEQQEPGIHIQQKQLADGTTLIQGEVQSDLNPQQDS